jgi:Ni,Fe-hydrogenase I cytochrome b subunit
MVQEREDRTLALDKSVVADEAKYDHDSGPMMAKEILLIEYGQLGRSLLTYEMVGRVLSVMIILWEGYLRYINMSLGPIVLLVLVFATFWIFGAASLHNRRQSMGKLIAENAYFQDQEWGNLYIRTYQGRYEGGINSLRRFMLWAEPITWVVLSIVVLLWR